MDDYILQILRANSVAKVQVKQTLESHADDIQKLQVKKDAIDVEVKRIFEEEMRLLESTYNSFEKRVEPVYAQEYTKRVLDLESRFSDAYSKWYQTLLEGIKKPYGK
jgi:hypothetical protein